MDLENIRKIWDTIIDYERSWRKSANATIPTEQLLQYFGEEAICSFYGCTVRSEDLAKELIKLAFEK